MLGLSDALKSLCTQLQRHLAIEIRFTSHGITRQVPADVSLCLFRVLQEALINAAKHADTRRIVVELRGARRLLRLRIRDFGTGFSIGSATEGLGLVSMRERVALIGGTFSIVSTPGSGTEINVHIPLDPSAPDQGEEHVPAANQT
jgi:signal transduction histidine kinase